MQRHDVGRRERREQVVVASDEGRTRPVRLGESGDPAPDPARPDDEHLLALEALADHVVRPPLPVVAAPERAVPLAHAAKEREDERDRVLGGGVRENAWRVAGDDVALADGREVEVVDADGVVRDDPKLRASCVEERGVDRDRRGDDHAVGTRGPVDELERLAELCLDLGGHACRLVDAGPCQAARRARAARARTSRRPCAGSGRSRTGTRRCRPTRRAGRHASSPSPSTR